MDIYNSFHKKNNDLNRDYADGYLKGFEFGLKVEKSLRKSEKLLREKIGLALDNVNRPAHYTDGKIEVIEFIEDKKLGFCLGNAVKYISRAGKKDPTKEVEDLQKAKWYIERRIKELEEV